MQEGPVAVWTDFQLRCQVGGYEWTNRARGLPKMCPDCYSRHWNKRLRVSFDKRVQAPATATAKDDAP